MSTPVTLRIRTIKAIVTNDTFIPDGFTGTVRGDMIEWERAYRNFREGWIAKEPYLMSWSDMAQIPGVEIEYIYSSREKLPKSENNQ